MPSKNKKVQNGNKPRKAPVAVKRITDVVIRKSNVPRPPASNRNAFINWLAAAKRDPWDTKPPLLGIRNEPTMVIQLRHRATYVVTGNFKVVARPHAAYNFGVSLNVDTNSDPVSWYSSLNQSTVSSMFTGARVLAGGLKMTPVFAATSAPGFATCTQQATNRAWQGWFDNGANLFRLNASLFTAVPTSPIATIAGVPIVQLYHTEDYEDLQVDSDLVASSVSGSTCNHPQMVAAFAGMPASCAIYIDSIFWLEAVLRDDIASLFGGTSRNNLPVNPSVVLDAEEKTPDPPNAGSFMAATPAAASAAYNACMSSDICRPMATAAAHGLGRILSRQI